MYPISPLSFYPPGFSGSAEPDFSSNWRHGECWPKGLYFGTELKDETPISLHLSMTVNWRIWGHQDFGEQDQKSEWVQVIRPKWNEMKDRKGSVSKSGQQVRRSDRRYTVGHCVGRSPTGEPGELGQQHWLQNKERGSEISFLLHRQPVREYMTTTEELWSFLI